MNLTIGSGDISALMMGKETQGFKDLMRKFLSDDKPNYNSFASPIDALRTGAILERNYLATLPGNYFAQWKETSKDMDVFTSSIDFAKIEKGICVDFDELKTIYLTDFIDIIQPIKELDHEKQIEFLKKKFKKNYQQIQIQLECAGISAANLVFLSVESYDDIENFSREIDEKHVAKFRINRDEKCIGEIKSKASIFQTIKDYFK